MIDKNVEIMRLKDEGISIRGTAERLGIDRGSVEYALNKLKKINNITTVIEQQPVIEQTVINNDTVIEPVIKRYCTREEIYEIPIIKLFKWKLTPTEEEEVMATGELHPNPASDYDMLRGHFHPEKITDYKKVTDQWLSHKAKSK